MTNHSKLTDMVLFFLDDRVAKGQYAAMHAKQDGIRSRQIAAVIDFICEVFPEAVERWADKIPGRPDFVSAVEFEEVRKERDSLTVKLERAYVDIKVLEGKLDYERGLTQRERAKLDNVLANHKARIDAVLFHLDEAKGALQP